MARAHRVRKTDANHSSVSFALSSAGWSVTDTSSMGGGFPDIVISQQGLSIFVEIKGVDPRLTQKEFEFHRDWRGGPLIIVDSAVEALSQCTMILMLFMSQVPMQAIVAEYNQGYKKRKVR